MELLSSLFRDFGEIFNENSPAFDTPTSTLEAMWLVRWGNDWVTAEEIKEDPFWANTFMRLVMANFLESHRLVTAPDGNSGLTYRIKNHANS